MRTRGTDGKFSKEKNLQTPEARAARKNAYYLKNKERIIARSVEWARNNKDKRKVTKDKWREKNKEHTNFLTRSYHYRRKHAVGSHTLEQEQQLKSLFSKCGYCWMRGADTLEHILPLSRGGSNNIENLLYVCISCNSSKGGKTVAEWRPLEAMNLVKLYGSELIYGI